MKTDHIVITRHSIDRYIERCDVHASPKEAQVAIERALQWGRPVAWKEGGTALISAGGKWCLVVTPLTPTRTRDRARGMSYSCVTCITKEMAQDSWGHQIDQTG